MNEMMESVWVFIGIQSGRPGGVFLDLGIAEEWIKMHSLSGTLSEYPANEGVFDWAARTGRIKQSFVLGAAPEIIGSFCSHVNHHHYENGERLT